MNFGKLKIKPQNIALSPQPKGHDKISFPGINYSEFRAVSGKVSQLLKEYNK